MSSRRGIEMTGGGGVSHIATGKIMGVLARCDRLKGGTTRCDKLRLMCYPKSLKNKGNRFREFESHRFRQEIKKPPSRRFFIAWRKRARRLRALRVRFEGLGVSAQPAPNPPPAAAARQHRAPPARVRGSDQVSTEFASTAPYASVRV